MKRKLLALALGCLLCLGLALPAFGAVEELVDLRVDDVTAYSQETGIYTVRTEGRYGFYRADGIQLVAPEYAAVGEFSGGMAAVSLSGEWERVRAAGGGTVRVLRGGRFGYVDTGGTQVVPMKYSRAFPYSEGRAFAVDAVSGVLVLLDELGRELASFPEAEVLEGETVRFSEGRAILPIRRQIEAEEPQAGGDAGPTDPAEEPLVPVETGEPERETTLCYLVIDDLGRELFVLTDAYVDFTEGYRYGRVAVAAEGEWVVDGAGPTRYFLPSSDCWGYRDERGETAVSGVYASAAAFSGDGMAAVSIRSEEGGILWGFVNPEGSEAVPLEYDAVQSYEEGMAAVCRDGAWAYVDLNGRAVTGFLYEEAGAFREGVALARRNGRLNAVDRWGRTLFTVEAAEGRPFSGGVTALRQADGLYGIYDSEGGELVPFSYDNAFHWDGYLWLKRGNLWRVYETAEVIAARQATPDGMRVEVGTFTDVPADAWYAEAVTWATDHDVITGTGGGQFSPDKSCTVGEILTFLWRAMGRPEAAGGENPFTDVTPNHYYYQAAMWAYEYGLVEGDVFGAAALCSRSMAVSYLWRLAGSPMGHLAHFADVPWDAPYSWAVAWAVDAGVTSGSGGTYFAPQEICSRGQIVTFLYRYLSRD